MANNGTHVSELLHAAHAEHDQGGGPCGPIATAADAEIRKKNGAMYRKITSLKGAS